MTHLPHRELPRCTDAIGTKAFADIVRTMALEHQKWDAQVGDLAAMAPFPLVISREAWESLSSLAVALSRETLAMERELGERPDLHARLGLSPALARALHPDPRRSAPPAPARIMRFDFHPTDQGWLASEVNSDVPGGFTESSRFAGLIADRTRAGVVTGDAADAWTAAIGDGVPDGGCVALLSAAGWVEDAQVVSHLASRFGARGIRAYLVSPRSLRWTGGRAHVKTESRDRPVDALVRFYQAEWIAELGFRDAWAPLFGGGCTPVSNPTSAALTESKRLALMWSELESCTDTWRSVTPEARDPREARKLFSGDWVLKPAFGNTGDDVLLRSRVPRSAWVSRVASALLRPRRWVAQRRFESVAIESPLGRVHACIGVYVVDGKAAGAYGRISQGCVIDYAAIDTAVLVEG